MELCPWLLGQSLGILEFPQNMEVSGLLFLHKVFVVALMFIASWHVDLSS